MSQDIEIDPDSRTIKYYDQRRVGEVSEDAIIEHIQAGGSFINNAQARFLLDEIDRLRKSREHHRQTALDISEDNDQLQKQIEVQNLRMQDLFQKAERLEKLVPPESERGPGFVGQGSWSVFAEKVVEERDELRDELSSLCEEIRCLTEENDELREELEQLGAMIAEKKEHTNTHFNDKKDFVGLDGYGRFSIQKANDCLWILKLSNETVTFYNRKGRRVCANHVRSGDT
jgi:hypothetical protein